MKTKFVFVVLILTLLLVGCRTYETVLPAEGVEEFMFEFSSIELDTYVTFQTDIGELTIDTEYDTYWYYDRGEDQVEYAIVTRYTSGRIDHVIFHLRESKEPVINETP